MGVILECFVDPALSNSWLGTHENAAGDAQLRDVRIAVALG